MTEPKRSIAVDVMGADMGPEEVIWGIREALDEGYIRGSVLAVGHEEIVQPVFDKLKLTGDPRVSIFHASEVIEMGEKPIQSLKQKKDASLARAVELVKLGTCAAAVSCGNTGSLMACSTLRLRPLEGVLKPALGTVWPGKECEWVFLDAGANPEAGPENLVHNAILGKNYAVDVLQRKNPRIGLLSIGTEEGKGNKLTAETHELLKKLSEAGQINYHGLVEGFNLYNNVVDVVVTDGFTGNVVLKSSEALFRFVKVLIKENVGKNPLRMLGAGLMSPVFDAMKERVDPARYGGAPLLGLRGTVLKTHGSSSRDYIKHAIRIAEMTVDNHLIEHISGDIAKANSVIKKVVGREETAAGSILRRLVPGPQAAATDDSEGAHESGPAEPVSERTEGHPEHDSSESKPVVGENGQTVAGEEGYEPAHSQHRRNKSDQDSE